MSGTCNTHRVLACGRKLLAAFHSLPTDLDFDSIYHLAQGHNFTALKMLLTRSSLKCVNAAWAMAFHEELYDAMDNPMDLGASKRALKHGLCAQKNVMGSIRTMYLQDVPVNMAWVFKAADLLPPHGSALDRSSFVPHMFFSPIVCLKYFDSKLEALALMYGSQTATAFTYFCARNSNGSRMIHSPFAAAVQRRKGLPELCPVFPFGFRAP